MPFLFYISGYLKKNNHPITRMAQRLLLPLLIYMLIIVMPFGIILSIGNLLYFFFNRIYLTRLLLLGTK